MKKNVSIIGIVLLLIISMLGYGIYWSFYDIQRLKGQEVIQEVSSPNGTYTVTAYLNNGGATTDYAVLCSVKANGRNKEKNIYWQYHCENASIVWLDDCTVQINGIQLNVKKIPMIIDMTELPNSNFPNSLWSLFIGFFYLLT